MPKVEFKHKGAPPAQEATPTTAAQVEAVPQAPESRTETVVVEERKLDFTERRNQPLPARTRRYFMSGR